MTDPKLIPPTPKAINEAFELAELILKELELSDLPLGKIALKCCRLARLMNDFEREKMFFLEIGGYPRNDTSAEILATKLGGRGYQQWDKEAKKYQGYWYMESIEQIEHTVQMSKTALQAAEDPDVSLSSANPHQTVMGPMGNALERRGIRDNADRSAKLLAQRRATIYEYVSRTYYELKFSGIVGDIFSRVRQRVDKQLGALVPDATKKLTAAYDNLRSENPEDWANAVHSCRRLLQAVADAIYPPTADKVIEENGKQRTVKLGVDAYKNRIIAFVDDRSDSQRFKDIVGSHLSFLGDRLDSVFLATQKGSHAEVSQEEADRYVVYSYLLVGDLLSLVDETNVPGARTT